ncbi:hypothetical protein A9Q84_00200 [Halobacteriovorax marinus]|uniref:Outer membrane protein assembly factor BamE domain-containing protein n=1 Tax=Halobacteriovorax marinus TaxID=97084 RepID=A0A1Y5FDK4_9BACT|nr:hypothetical protein A9Q84_00200 [Halobacteriovorax marinus]
MKHISLILLAIFFTSCATNPSIGKLAKVENGMSVDQVEKILGKKYVVVQEGNGDYEYAYRYTSYANRQCNCSKLSVFFTLDGFVKNRAITSINNTIYCVAKKEKFARKMDNRIVWNSLFAGINKQQQIQSQRTHEVRVAQISQTSTTSNKYEVFPICPIDNRGNMHTLMCYSTITECRSNLGSTYVSCGRK